ncbi:MAG TPA: BatD family protein [Candidatus Cloacimonas sp.]|jgi:hypothetical protein|nr:BatD family protein [Candidatus Cloacimonas sp.]MDD2249673.1 BatD family protein [Candidatus Cloacimonadota bacterium]MCK9165622.1 BatD family protein [Candidatus Cloacimonas sp.]MDD3733644.1 BatD family protein [Candidatus Cloacimonadota bacterium]MDD3869235.1 BatD family protein [Candidatus Cloacimonadota bacterium]
MKKTILLIMLFPLMLSALKIDLSVNKYVISTNDQLEVTLKITDSDRIKVVEPTPPSIPLFSFRNMTSGSSSSVVFEGTKLVSEFSETFRFFYFPLKTGKTTIPSFQVKVNGRFYSTREINIEVVKGTSKAPSQSAPSYPNFGAFGFDEPDSWDDREQWIGDSFLLAIPQEQTIYRGFPTIVSYYLYTDEMVRSFNLENEIDSDGYGKSTYEQPSVLNYENVNLNGKQYKRALIKRLAIIPNKEGRLQAPILEGYARLYRFSYSNKTLRSEGGIINVLPLPKNNVPASFGGAVGDFKISYSLSRKELSLGETITFTLKIKGRGNFNQFSAPEFASGKGFQVSTPMVIDNLKAGIEGERTYYYTLIPQDKGSYELPELSFTWFDNYSGSYKTYRSPKEMIKVSSANVLSYFNRLRQSKTPKAMLPKVVKKHFPPYVPYVQQPWYWILVLLIFAFSLFVAFFALDSKMKRDNPERYASLKAEKVLLRYLKPATLAAKNLSLEFYPLAEKALFEYLASKYKLSNRLSTKEKLQALSQENIPDWLLEEIQLFLNHSQAARFMPESERAVNLDEDLNRIRKIFNGFTRLGKNKHNRSTK